MLIKIAIIFLLIILVFGCNDGGSVTRYSDRVYDQPLSNEQTFKIEASGGERIYRGRYMSGGMVYEVVYLYTNMKFSKRLNIVNITRDSLECEALRLTTAIKTN